METTTYSVADNVKYLASGMFYLGFGNKHEDTLMQKLNSNLESFQILQPSANQKMGADYDVDFKKAEGQEWTNLSGYRATLKKDPEKTQYFTVYKNHGVTNKQAFNMLEGRSVCKEHVNKAGMKYEMWYKLDFENRTEAGNFVTKKFPENHGFSIEAAFNKIDFAREVPDWSIAALKKGDEFNAPVLVNGQTIDVVLTANPEIRAIDGKDINGNLVLQVEGINELIIKEKQQTEQTGQSQPMTDNTPTEQKTPELTTDIQENKKADFWSTDKAEGQYWNGIEAAEQQGVERFERESGQQEKEQEAGKDHNLLLAESQDKPKFSKGGDVEGAKTEHHALKTGTDQQKATAANQSESSKSKVERKPPRQHPPLEQSAQGKGKRR